MNKEDEQLSTDLTVADLKVVTALIEACTTRGVFKANELTIIGKVYDKIAAILKPLENENKGN
jgi:hypothetical protein